MPVLLAWTNVNVELALWRLFGGVWTLHRECVNTVQSVCTSCMPVKIQLCRR